MKRFIQKIVKLFKLFLTSMQIEILISCMYQDALSLIKRTNIKGHVLVVNQCDEHGYYEVGNNRIISSLERGLSCSRNMTLENAREDVCLICDDDEVMYDDYEAKILQAFEEQPAADIIAFQIDDAGKPYPPKSKKLNYLTVLKVASWQIAFRRKSIICNNILFDETLGSGVSKAGGEEVMFLYDCLKHGLQIYFVPISIGRMIEGESKWFYGWTKEYFFDRGIFTVKLMGRVGAFLYALYFLIFKYSLYKKDISFQNAFISIYRGVFFRK